MYRDLEVRVQLPIPENCDEAQVEVDALVLVLVRLMYRPGIRQSGQQWRHHLIEPSSCTCESREIGAADRVADEPHDLVLGYRSNRNRRLH